jgi:hypothetical protein
MEGDFAAESCTLWAQVQYSSPDHGHDPEGDLLRSARHPACEGKVMLGNVADALLGVFGTHQTPVLLQPPQFDEQRWVLEVRDSELCATITSTSYWGWGLFSKCFLNQINLKGPSERIERIVYDLLAALGKSPWECFRRKKFVKASGLEIAEHKAAWLIWQNRAQQMLEDRIENCRNMLNNSTKRLSQIDLKRHPDFDLQVAKDGLDASEDDLAMAENALADRNSLAVERAIDRIELALINADPSTASDAKTFLAPDDAPSLQAAIAAEQLLEPQRVEWVEVEEEDDGDIVDLTDSGDDVSADWLLSGNEVDETPLIDLSNTDESE